MKNQGLFARTRILMAWAVFGACSSPEPRRLDLDDLSFMKPSLTLYEAMIFQFGRPLQEEASGDEFRATYPVKQELASVTNINGKGFARRVGGLVNAYPTGPQEVTLVFNAKNRRYKRLQWQLASSRQDP